MPPALAPVIPTSLFRATILFELGTNGWSESYYNTATGYPQFAPRAVSLANARMKMCPPAVKCLGIRLSTPGHFRDVRFIEPLTSYAILGIGVPGSQTLYQDGQYQTTPPGATPAQPVEPSICLLVRLEATSLHRRLLELRGIPESIVGTAAQPFLVPAGTQYNFNAPGWTAKFGFFKSSLLGLTTANPAPWQLIALDTTQPPNVVSSVSLTTDGHGILVGGFPAAGLVPGIPWAKTGGPVAVQDFVKLTGVRGAHSINGVWRVVNITTVGATPHYVYELRGSATRQPTFPDGASVSNAVAVFYALVGQSIDTVADERLASRQTGRPFGLPRGRGPTHR